MKSSHEFSWFGMEQLAAEERAEVVASSGRSTWQLRFPAIFKLPDAVSSWLNDDK